MFVHSSRSVPEPSRRSLVSKKPEKFNKPPKSLNQLLKELQKPTSDEDKIDESRKYVDNLVHRLFQNE